MVSNANVLANSQLIFRDQGHSSESIGVSWLPVFHDMGLMGGIFQPLFGGFPMVLMPPAAFLQKPSRWLQAITRYKATFSGGPNFAYDICANEIPKETLGQYDLSTWTAAINGAEPIQPNTIKQFTQHFAPCG